MWWEALVEAADGRAASDSIPDSQLWRSDGWILHHLWRHSFGFYCVPQPKQDDQVSQNYHSGGLVELLTVSRLRIFSYIYFGILTPSVPLLILGAAIGGALNNVPEWKSGWEVYGIGGVMAAMLAPAGGFGKFVLVILALSVIGNIATSMYSVALCMQMMLPVFTRVPRVVFIVVALGIMIPMAIRAAEAWENSLGNFLGLIGYWAGCFDAVIIEELVVFRRMDYGSYNHAAWNVARMLPSGLAAIGASLLSFGLIIPGMDQAWFTGPFAKSTGDIGFELAFVLTAIFYAPLRWLEIKKQGRV